MSLLHACLFENMFICLIIELNDSNLKEKYENTLLLRSFKQFLKPVTIIGVKLFFSHLVFFLVSV